MSRRRWVTTRAEYQWRHGKYELVRREGYWYEGPWALAHDVAPTWEAEDFRWYADDGAIGARTALAAENTGGTISGIGPGSAVGLRVNVAESAGAAGTGEHTGGWKLQFRVNTGGGFGAWTDVGASTAVAFYNSSNLTNGTAIGTGSFVLNYGGAASTSQAWGDECEDGTSASNGPWSNDYAEIEYSLQFDAGQSAGDVFEFRVIAPDGSSAVAFANTPTITLDAASVNTTGDAPTAVAAAQAGTVTATGDSSVTLTGIAAAAQSGSVEAIGDPNKSANAASRLGPLGVPQRQYGSFDKGGAVDATGNVTGVSAPAESGTVTATGDASSTLTGVAAPAQPGTVVATGDSSVTLTGVDAPAESGSVTGTGDSAVTLTGAEAPGQAGTVTATGDSSSTLTGVGAPAEAGTVTATGVGDETASVTGVAAPGEAGTVTVTGDSSVTLTGVSAPAQAASVTATGDSAVTLSGVSAPAEAGTVTGSADFTRAQTTRLSPLGTPTRLYGDFGKVVDATASLTGAAVEGQAGSVTAATDNEATLTGAGTAAEAGTVTATGATGGGKTDTTRLSPLGTPMRLYGTFGAGPANITVTLQGVELTAEFATFNVSDLTQHIDGAQAPVEAGSVEGRADHVTLVTGAAAPAQAGTVTAFSHTTATLTGAAAAAESGLVQVETSSPTDVTFEVLGRVVAAQAGQVTVKTDALVVLTGAEARAEAGFFGLQGAEAQCEAGAVEATTDCLVTLQGVGLQAQAGTVRPVVGDIVSTTHITFDGAANIIVFTAASYSIDTSGTSHENTVVTGSGGNMSFDGEIYHAA